MDLFVRFRRRKSVPTKSKSTSKNVRFAAGIVIDFWWTDRRGGEGGSDGVGENVGSRLYSAGDAGGGGGEGNRGAVSTWLSCDGANASVPCSNLEVGLRFLWDVLVGEPSSELTALYVRLVLRDCELMTMR